MNKKVDKKIIVYPYHGTDIYNNMPEYQLLCYMEKAGKKENTVRICLCSQKWGVN